MVLSTFKLLLLLIILIPTFLGFYTLGFTPEVAFPSILCLLSLLSYLFRKQDSETPKGVKLVFFTFIGLHGLNALFKFSIDNLPLHLFGFSQLFIAYLLWWEESFRKYLYAVLLSFLNLTVVSLYFQNLLYGLFLGLYLFLVLFIFLLLAVESYKKEERKIFTYLFKYSLFVYTAVLVFGTVLFFILPRPNQPVFTLVHKEKKVPAVGFSNKVKLGEFNKIFSDPTVVFRAKLPTRPKELYWRGNTLESFNGKSWTPLKVPYATVSVPKILNNPVKETLLLNPYGEKNLFTYLYPVKILKSSFEGLKIDRTKNVVFAEKSINQPLKAEILATSPQQVKVKLTKQKVLLEIPQNLRPIIEKIAKKYHLGGKNFYQTRLNVEKFFQGFKYSLTNKAKDIVEFLTVYKEGNCEYFATASALIFRYLGYPTRLVVGFYGGDYNPITGYYVVRQKDAHAWVEIFYKNRWWRFDGTKYAAVDRKVETTVRSYTLQKRKLALIWDTLNTIWIEYVVNLNQEKQIKVLGKVKNTLDRVKVSFKRHLHLWLGIFSLILSLWIVLNYKKLLLFLLKIYLLVKESVPISLRMSAIETYNYLWENEPKTFRRFKRLLKFLAN